MKILIIGSGGREHVLVWKIAQSSVVEKVYCAPGNAGTAENAENVPIGVDEFEKLLDFARANEIDLTVIGPEDPLVNGIVDLFTDAGLKVFGPKKIAAQLEGSKSFAKRLMAEYDIPTATYSCFTSIPEAKQYLQDLNVYPVVLKASGLAAGKGVLICQNEQEAYSGLDDLLKNKVFGTAGDEVIIEEFLTGEEVSVFVLCDGKNYRILTSSQDHKRAFDGDEGKNTGGMGAYAPAPAATNELMDKVEKNIIQPSLQAIAEKATPYTGILYIGLMIAESGPKVLEYNCRFGDPETEVVLPLLKSDLVPLMIACTEGNLEKYEVEVCPGYAIDVVLASGGYPDSYNKGIEISGITDIPEDILVFHAGTKIDNGKLVTSGGRVLNVIAMGSDFKQTQNYLYQNINKIYFQDMHYRKDIGFRAINHLET